MFGRYTTPPTTGFTITHLPRAVKSIRVATPRERAADQNTVRPVRTGFTRRKQVVRLALRVRHIRDAHYACAVEPVSANKVSQNTTVRRGMKP